MHLSNEKPKYKSLIQLVLYEGSPGECREQQRT